LLLAARVNIIAAVPRPMNIAVLVALAASSCVNVDPKTGDTIPRGNQKYYYEQVTENAKQLHKGMSKLDVLLLLGSAAEESKDGDTWVYLPERPAVLVPASALKLQFGPDGGLADWGYHPIVLGLRM
jgi:outer membrane protein assembly factor BamE (lipoprotein component of BamABCDE complex)